MEKLSTQEGRVVQAAVHLVACTEHWEAEPTSMVLVNGYNQAVKILRAALAMWEFENSQVRAEKAMKEKDGLTT